MFSAVHCDNERAYMRIGSCVNSSMFASLLICLPFTILERLRAAMIERQDIHHSNRHSKKKASP